MKEKYNLAIESTDYVPGTDFANNVDKLGATLEQMKGIEIDYQVVRQKFTSNGQDLAETLDIMDFDHTPL
jgi:hypothetical protein